MKINEKLFVIACVNDDVDDKDTIRFLADDESGSGCFFWSNLLGSAKFFNSANDAINIIKTHPHFNKNDRTMDGTIYPPRLIQEGANICNAKMKGRVIIRAYSISISSFVFSRTQEGEIKEPKGFTY